MCIGVIVALEDIALLPLRGGNGGPEIRRVLRLLF